MIIAGIGTAKFSPLGVHLANPDYFEIIGLPRSASDHDILLAWRDWQRRPDTGDSSIAACRRQAEVEAAFLTLSKPKMRKLWELENPVDGLSASSLTPASPKHPVDAEYEPAETESFVPSDFAPPSEASHSTSAHHLASPNLHRSSASIERVAVHHFAGLAAALALVGVMFFAACLAFVTFAGSDGGLPQFVAILATMIAVVLVIRKIIVNTTSASRAMAWKILADDAAANLGSRIYQIIGIRPDGDNSRLTLAPLAESLQERESVEFTVRGRPEYRMWIALTHDRQIIALAHPRSKSAWEQAVARQPGLA